MDVELPGVGETVAQSHLGRDVEDVARDGGVDLARAIIGQFGLLRHKVDPGVEAYHLRVVADAHAGAVGEVFIGGILAVLVIAHHHERVNGRGDIAQGMTPHVVVAELIKGAIAVGVAVRELVVELQVPVLGYRLAVTSAHRGVPVFRRIIVELVEPFIGLLGCRLEIINH